MPAPNQAVTRVIHHLDSSGRVVGVEIDGASAPLEAKIIETRDVLARAEALLHLIDTLEDHRGCGAEQSRGYRLALDHLQASDEYEALQAALRKLRPYLALTHRAAEQGLLFPTARGTAEFPDGAQPKRRQA